MTGNVESAAEAARRAREALIVALDVPEVEQARRVVAELGGLAGFFKIGLHLQLLRGTERLIDELIEAGNRVFIDYKFSDIPATMRGGVAAAARRGVDFVTIQGHGDLTPEALRTAAEGREGAKPKLLLVTLLTSLAASGTGGNVEDVVERRARMAFATGLDGVIASGREAGLIKRATADGFLVVAPGIRPAGAGVDDHRRAVTPAEAIAAGADYLVVGRPIVAAPDRAAAARRILAEMAAAFAARDA